MKIVLYIIGALWVVGAGLATLHLLRKAKRREKQAEGWPRVQATVTGSVAGWSRSAGSSPSSRRYFPTYQFTDPHGTLFAGESEVSLVNRPQPGSLVQVTYNPLNPNQSFQVASDSKKIVGCLIPFLVVFSILLFNFISIFPVD
ncbi:DUF3592 domain-containing protein [Arthrobacter sp. D1-29]